MTLEKHIGYWLRSVSNQVSGSFAKELALHDSSIGEWVVLNLLNGQTLSPAVIAEKTGLTRGAASKILDKLVHKELVHRHESLEDRRYQEISLSKKGKRLLPKLMDVADRNDHNFFGHLSGEEKETLMVLLHQIASKHNLKNIPID